MTWKRLEEYSFAGDGGGVSIGFDIPGDRPRTVEVSSADRDVAREAADLIQEALAARKRRKRELAGESRGYAVVFIGPAGYGMVHVQIREPGLVSFDQLMHLQASFAKELGGPVAILNWQEIDPPSPIVRPTPGG